MSLIKKCKVTPEGYDVENGSGIVFEFLTFVRREKKIKDGNFQL